MACTIVDNLLVKVRHGQNAQFTADRATGSGGEIRSFEQKLEKDTVPLELIMLHMRLLMPELLKDKEVKFPIYASMLALELEEQLRQHPIAKNLNRAWMVVAQKK